VSSIDPDSPNAPPHDFRLERGILGMLLSNPDALDEIAGVIDVAGFTDPDHGKLFTEIVARRATGLDASVLALRTWADANMRAKSPYLATVLAASHAIRDLTASARSLNDITLRRDALVIRDELTALASDQSAGVRARYSRLLDQAGELLQRGAGSGLGLQSAPLLLPMLHERVEDAYKRGDGLAGLSTGYSSIDFHLGGLAPGNLIVLAARPSHGKSALALSIAETVARDVGPVAFFSLEMSQIELLQRLVAQRAELSVENVRRGRLSTAEIDRLMTEAHGLEELSRLHIDDTAGMTLALLAARARALRRRQPDLALIVVDHLQIMRPPLTQQGATRNDIVGGFSRGLKELAKELDLPVLALCQLSRASERRGEKDHRPQLSDLRDSGNIEQDADVVMFIHREAVRLAASPKPEDQAEADRLARHAELIIAKNRHGRIGVVSLAYDGPSIRFHDVGWSGSPP